MINRLLGIGIYTCLAILAGLSVYFAITGDVPWILILPILIWGGGMLIAISIERARYKPTQLTADGWQPTGERFIDHSSGKTMEVDYNPTTGQRRYREVETS